MRCSALALVVVLAWLPAGVRADDKPWAANVSDANQKLALEKFKAGNEQFVKDEWEAALLHYREALKLWDHPNINYNAAICLIKLRRMVEAYQHMTAALRFGAAPLGKDLHEKGLVQMDVLAASVAHLEIRCHAEGARVTLDGKVLYEACPKTAKQHIVAGGKHQIVSEKPGYKTETRELDVPGGARETVVIVMQREGTRPLVRRWSKWKPWVALLGGVFVGVASVPLWLQAAAKFEDYDAAVAQTCGEKLGCPPGDPALEPLRSTRSRGRTYNGIAIAATTIGAASIATGVLMLWLNQPRLGPLTLTPEVGPERANISLAIEW